MGKKRRRKASKTKIRIFLTLIVFSIIFITLGIDCLSNITKIRDLKKEKEVLNEKIVKLEEEKEILESDILRLKDPEYIAKYVREKYYFSKDGELILKMDNKKSD